MATELKGFGATEDRTFGELAYALGDVLGTPTLNSALKRGVSGAGLDPPVGMRLLSMSRPGSDAHLDLAESAPPKQKWSDVREQGRGARLKTPGSPPLIDGEEHCASLALQALATPALSPLPRLACPEEAELRQRESASAAAAAAAPSVRNRNQTPIAAYDWTKPFPSAKPNNKSSTAIVPHKKQFPPVHATAGGGKGTAPSIKTSGLRVCRASYRMLQNLLARDGAIDVEEYLRKMLSQAIIVEDLPPQPERLSSTNSVRSTASSRSAGSSKSKRSAKSRKAAAKKVVDDSVPSLTLNALRATLRDKLPGWEPSATTWTEDSRYYRRWSFSKGGHKWQSSPLPPTVIFMLQQFGSALDQKRALVRSKELDADAFVLWSCNMILLMNVMAPCNQDLEAKAAGCLSALRDAAMARVPSKTGGSRGGEIPGMTLAEFNSWSREMEALVDRVAPGLAKKQELILCFRPNAKKLRRKRKEQEPTKDLTQSASENQLLGAVLVPPSPETKEAAARPTKRAKHGVRSRAESGRRDFRPMAEREAKLHARPITRPTTVC